MRENRMFQLVLSKIVGHGSLSFYVTRVEARTLRCMFAWLSFAVLIGVVLIIKRLLIYSNKRPSIEDGKH